MALKKINPNSDRHYVDSINLEIPDNFPFFLKSIKLEPFRHIENLVVNFQHPISIICGTNRSGKSTILMALACSHFEFNKRNVQNGRFERHTWSSLMQFTNHDKQLRDWNYYITYKRGAKSETKRGQRKAITNKWNGLGKKESQFKGRQVFFLDLERVLPARNFGRTIYHRARRAIESVVSTSSVIRIEKYLSYILEENFNLHKLAKYADKDIFRYNNSNEYSSYNAATGEEVLSKIIIDVVEAQNNSLILIDEIEVGLHPKVQRRLMDVIYHISRTDKKQFIISSHSPSILSSVPDKSRIFIQKSPSGEFKSLSNISVNACLSKMDSFAYPLFDLYCEDSAAKKIIQKAITSIQSEKQISNFGDLVNIIVSGSGDRTFTYFSVHKETYPSKKIKTGFACILDGDRRTLTTSSGDVQYPPEECLHFIYSDFSPEKFLLYEYLIQFPNPTLSYHLGNSNVHSLFDKMVECSICTTKEEAFEICWNVFLNTTNGQTYFEELKNFIIAMVDKYSPEL